MFRAGHAHAGVLVIFSLITQVLIDASGFGRSIELVLSIAFPLSAILISGGFFAAAAGDRLTRPNSKTGILYAGMFLLAAALITLGTGLIINS